MTTHRLMCGAALLLVLVAARAQTPAAAAASAAASSSMPSSLSTRGAATAAGRPFSFPGAPAGVDTAQPPPVIRNDEARPEVARPGNSLEESAAVGALREPAQVNEFQRFVAKASGQQLPMFGEHFFRNAPRTFAPLERVPVPADYVLGPGDEIYIRAWGSIDVDYRATIDRDGMVGIPRVGTLGVAGVKAADIEPFLKTRFAREFRNFSLSVTLGQLRSIQVFVVGQARRPGTYTVGSLSTLVNVVFASGGPGPNGSLRRVQVRRDDKLLIELDLYDFIVNGNKRADIRLLPGDVIVYVAAGPYVALLGALDTPAVYEMAPKGETIATLLTYGGGTRASTDQQLTQLERIDPGSSKAARSVMTIALDRAGRDTLLRDGDMLTLFAVSPQFSNAVTLRGNVARPLRYAFSEGMRVSTLIPEREALITPDYFVRKNRLVQFVEVSDVAIGAFERDVRNIVDEVNWEYAAIERLDPAGLTMQVIAFNLGRAVLARDPTDDLLLRPGDVVTIFSRRDIRSPVARQTRLVRVEGEVAAPGVYQLAAGDTLRSLIVRAGGLTPQAYVFGTEFSREETRRKQRIALDAAARRVEVSMAGQAANISANAAATAADGEKLAQTRLAQDDARRAQMARLRSVEPSGRVALRLSTSASRIEDLPDLPLENGDRVTVPNRPGFVFAVGAVANADALLWTPGQAMHEYLALAGVEPEADRDNLFVLRADGTVLRAGQSLFDKSLEGLELMPGDTLVVPDKLDRTSRWNRFVGGLKDWTQILYQLGLSAAAIYTLRN